MSKGCPGIPSLWTANLGKFSALLQWNCQGLRAKYEELKLIMNHFSPLCVSLQETMLGDNRTPCPKEYTDYSLAYNPDQGHHGGSSIFVRRDVPHQQFPLQSQLQVVAVQLFLQRQYTICSIYLPPNEALNDRDLTSLLHQLPPPFLLLGDFNGRHPLWGDIVTNSRGNSIATIIEREDVGLLNTGEPTHFHVQTGTLSAIDLSICSNDALIDFQ